MLNVAEKIIEGIPQIPLQYIEEPHGYIWKGESVPYVTGIIKDLGLDGDFSKVKPVDLEYKCKLGKSFHLAARYLVTGRLDPKWSDPAVDPYLDGLKAFGRESGAIPLAAEVSLYSPEYGFACTIDSVWILNGLRTIIEYKTSEGVYPSEEYQTWGQELIWNFFFQSSPVHSRFALHVKKNGRYRLHDWNRREAENFLPLLFTWNEKKRNGFPCHVA